MFPSFLPSFIIEKIQVDKAIEERRYDDTIYTDKRIRHCFMYEEFSILMMLGLSPASSPYEAKSAPVNPAQQQQKLAADAALVGDPWAEVWSLL